MTKTVCAKKRLFLYLLMISFILIYTLSCSQVSLAAEADNPIKQIGLMDYVETLYDESNGLLTSEANTVLQDDKGYLWIGSYGGLSRYAGHEFENLSQLRPDAPKSGIRVLFQDSKNRIWIGTNDSGLYFFETEAFHQVTQIDTPVFTDVKKLSVRSMTEDQQGNLYVGTTSGLFFIEENKHIKKIAEDGIGEETVENLLCDNNGYIWATTRNQIFILRNQTIQLQFDQDFSFSNLGNGLFQTKDGNIYLGTETNQVLRIKITDGQYSKNNFQVDTLSTGSKETINDIYQDSQNKIWVCTDNGLGYFDNSDTFYEIYGLSSDTIMTKMCEDYEGNLWFTSSRKGFFGLIRSKFKNIGIEADIANQTVNSSILYHEKLYIGTDQGISIMDAEGNKITNNLTDQLSGIRIRNFMRDSRENLWISTYKQYGLLCYNDRTDSWRSLTTANGLPHDQVRMTCLLSNGDIAAATNGGVAIIRNGTVIDTFTAKDGIQNEVILCLTQTDDGTLFAGSDGNGIFAIDLKTRMVTNITTDDGLQSGVILRMVPDPIADGIWISNGAEIGFWQDHSFHPVSSVSAGVGSVFDIKVTEDALYLLKSFGIVKISREDLKTGTPNYTLYTRKDGLTSSITANSWNYLSNDGMLFLCTGNGVYYLNIDEIYRNIASPKIAINSITADNITYYGGSDLILPSDVQRIVLHLDLLSFGFADGVLEYYMEGFDREPIQMNSHSEHLVTYTNLPGGDYTFHLKGYNADGTSCDEVTVNLKKEKNFFEKRSFYVTLVLVGLLFFLICIVVIQNLNKNRILKQQRQYKNMTDQTIQIVAKTIDAKDKYTIGHSNRVAAYAVEIGRRYGLSEEQIEQLSYTALLHDIGKIGIPDHILNKSGKLTEEEYAIIKQHPSIGGEILKDFSLVPWISSGAQYHHERYDGKGYNEGLQGEEISLYARIISVADAYDSMNSTRVYRPSMTPEIIYQELKKGKGTQFDPTFAQIMMDMIEDHFEVE